MSENHFALVEVRSSSRPETKIYGPGYHFLGPYHYVQGQYTLQDKVPNNLIQSTLGDLTIITVDQGTIAMFEYNGQYKILGPGLHVIRDTMQFQQIIRLDKFYIRVGPEKWITIPDQYDGIAIDNGQTVILTGGRQYHLPHENYKFAKLVPKIILTDRIVTDVPKYIQNINRNRGDLPIIDGVLDPAYYLQTKTKDGSVLHLDTMLFWYIEDTDKAARRAMNIMELRASADDDTDDEAVHISSASRNIDNLRKTVLRYAKSCLSEVVGQCCLTDDEKFITSNVSGNARDVQAVDAAGEQSLVTLNFAIQNFLNKQARSLVTSLNRDLEEYGVHVSKITINDAIPTEDVQRQLDMQTKAKIDRTTELVAAETQRQVAEEFMRTDRIQRTGEANNRLEAARIAKQTAITEAEAIAEKERIIAQARKEAAELQESTTLGKQLAAISAVGEAAAAFNQGEGNKVYIVGSPLEAMSRTVGAAVPGIMTALSGGM